MKEGTDADPGSDGDWGGRGGGNRGLYFILYPNTSHFQKKSPDFISIPKKCCTSSEMCKLMLLLM